MDGTVAEAVAAPAVGAITISFHPSRPEKLPSVVRELTAASGNRAGIEDDVEPRCIEPADAVRERESVAKLLQRRRLAPDRERQVLSILAASEAPYADSPWLSTSAFAWNVGISAMSRT